MKIRQFCIAIGLAMTVCAPASAQVSATIPNIYATTAGPGYSGALIGTTTSPFTEEMIWNASQLTGLIGSQLTSVQYRAGHALPNGYPFVTTTWSDYRISFAPSVAPSAASTTIADNLTASPTLVRSGPLTVTQFAWPVGGSPSPWGVQITFDTPYFYAGGNLAMIVSQPGSNNPDPGNGLLDSSSSASPGYGTDFQAVIGNSFTATTGSLSAFGTIVLLNGTTPVPEPTTFVLVGAVTMVVGVVRRRRQFRSAVFPQSPCHSL
jgi:hypothetical protein